MEDKVRDLLRELERILLTEEPKSCTSVDSPSDGNPECDWSWKTAMECGTAQVVSPEDRKLVEKYGDPYPEPDLDAPEFSKYEKQLHSLQIRMLLEIIRCVNRLSGKIDELEDRISGTEENLSKRLVDELDKRSIIQPVVVKYPETEEKKDLDKTDTIQKKDYPDYPGLEPVTYPGPCDHPDWPWVYPSTPVQPYNPWPNWPPSVPWLQPVYCSVNWTTPESNTVK